MTGSKSSFDREAAIEPRSTGRIRLIGLVAALFAALMLHFAARDTLREGLFDFYQRMQPRSLAAASVAVVQIDAESLRAVGQWPWSRYHLARLTEEIAARGATAIGFDMLFPEPDRLSPDQFAALYSELTPAAAREISALPSMDLSFATVIGRHPVVLARAGIDEQSVDFSERIYDDPAALPVEAEFTAPLPAAVRAFPRAVANIPALDEVAIGHGLINGAPDADGVIRRMPGVAMIAGRPTPGFAVELARVAGATARIDPIIDKGVLRAIGLGRHRIAVEPDGRYRVHFGTLPGEAIHSAVDVLRRNFPSDAFRGRIVLVSLAAAGTADIVATPLQGQTYGVLVQAQAVDALLRGGVLERPPWAIWIEAALGLVLALGAVLLAPRLRGLIAVLLPLGAVLAIGAASWIAFARFGLLIDAAHPLLMGIAPGLAMVLLLFVEAGRAQRRLRATLELERVVAARAAGELEAAHDIQTGMLPLPDQLARLDPAIDIAAALEPAREVGGDFFDAFRSQGGRACFVVGDVTGKGVPAALFMALSKAVARSILSRWTGDLGSAVTTLSDDLARDNSEAMFVTMLIGVLDGATGELQLCNAGHENPILLRAGGAIETFAMEGGPPLCVAGGFAYPVETIRLAPGDGLMFVTDGVTEAQNRTGDFFEAEGARAMLASLGPDWTASRATGAMVGAVRAFEAGGEPSDDLTVLALRFRG